MSFLPNSFFLLFLGLLFKLDCGNWEVAVVVEGFQIDQR